MIEVRDLAFRYPGSAAPAVRGLGFHVEEGEIFGFLGPSGAGKSTTQKILSGLLRDFTGRVTVLGRDLATWGPALYEQIGVSFDVPTLYLKLTGLENLRYFRSLYQDETEDAESLLEQVGLAQDAGLRVSQYSKGMKVRLGFARALLNRPQLLFLDENSKLRMLLSLSAEGNPTLSLLSGDGKSSVAMNTKADGSGTILLMGQDGATAGSWSVVKAKDDSWQSVLKSTLIEDGQEEKE